MVLVPGQGTRRQREAAADRREADVAAPPVADPVADPTAAPVADPATASAAAPIADSTVVPAAAPAADSTVAPAVDPAAVAPTPTEPPTVTSEDTQTETRE